MPYPFHAIATLPLWVTAILMLCVSTLLAALAYFELPTDAVPDILAGIGFTDDAAVIAAVVGTFARYITPEHRTRAARRLDELLR